MARPDRPSDEPPPADEPQPADEPTRRAGRPARPTDLRVRLLYDCFATPDAQLETTLPPDDPDADLTWGPLTFVWSTRSGDQPVIMPLWRRLD